MTEVFIRQYKEFIKTYSNYQPNFRILKNPVTGTTDQILELESILGNSLPQDLIDFYKEIGSIELDVKESFVDTLIITIYPVQRLINLLRSENKHTKIASMGLIDIIKEFWDNDRPEFTEYLSADEISFINDNYKCIGGYDEGSMNAHTYIYYDKTGKWSSLFYDQDIFDDLETSLKEMTKKSSANKTLEQVLTESFDRITGSF